MLNETARCRSCGKRFEVNSPGDVCPLCGSDSWTFEDIEDDYQAEYTVEPEDIGWGLK